MSTIHLGCWIRAHLFSALIVKRLAEHHPEMLFPFPKKHYVFGSLVAKTSNAVQGWVGWWYHVALIVKLNDGKLYVLDPALSPDPISKETWYELCTNGQDISGRVARYTGAVTCEHDTYNPGYDCFNPGHEIDADECTIFEAQLYLLL